MKKADFPKAVSDFLSVYLPSQRNFSKNTISSYCDTMKLFLRYCVEEKGCAIERLTLKQVNRAFVLSFMTWLERARHSSASTLNQRLACIHTFFRFVQMSYPEVLDQAQQILSIPFRKKLSPPLVISTLTILKSSCLNRTDTPAADGVILRSLASCTIPAPVSRSWLT